MDTSVLSKNPREDYGSDGYYREYLASKKNSDGSENRERDNGKIGEASLSKELGKEEGFYKSKTQQSITG